MAWKEQDLMSLRKEFVVQALKEDSNIAELCKHYDISRKTAYKWINRYEEFGDAGLVDLSRKPHQSPTKTATDVESAICVMREKHSTWGAKKIHTRLKKKGMIDLPVPSTIHFILVRNGYISENSNLAGANFKRFEHEQPNHLWQMDFKGHFAYEQGRCHPLTILDDHSRFSIALRACNAERGEIVKPLMIEAFRRYGIPDRINVDNGPPWGDPSGGARYTALGVWLIRLGIYLSYSRPRHPQTNGKIERFHRTLKAEVITAKHYKTLSHIQKAFDQWQKIYNLERPHEAIGLLTPVERYKPSYRKYPDTLPEVEYESDYVTRKVDGKGRIYYLNRELFVGTAFAKQLMGLRPTTKDGVFQLYYLHQKIAEINVGILPKESITSIYAQKMDIE